MSEIRAEKRINHPSDVFRVGQQVRAQVLAIDKEKRQLKLSVKQMEPSSLDEYLAERKAGDVVSGRVLEVKGDVARVELGEGVVGTARLTGTKPKEPQAASDGGNLDLSALSSMLSARWKSGPASGTTSTSESATAGQIRSFRITRIDLEKKQIELEQV